MARNSWLRRLKSLFWPKVKPITRVVHRIPRLESLEDRLAPATFTWVGGGGTANQNWSDGANWVGGVAPTGTGENLVFGSSATQRTTVDDLKTAGLYFDSITFSASNYTLSGNAITLGDPILGSGTITASAFAANNTISFGITMGGDAGSSDYIAVQTSASLTLSGNLSGTGIDLTKSGTGTLTLSGNNANFTDTGSITIGDQNPGGIVVATTSTALGDPSTQVTVLNNSQLQLNNSAGISFANPLILNGSGIIRDGALLNVAGVNTWSGPVELDSNVTVGANADSVEISGNISDTASGWQVTKEGVGEVIFSGVNTYRGGTVVNNGTLTASSDQALGAGDGTAATGTVVNSNATETGKLQISTEGNTPGLTIDNILLTLNGAGSDGLGSLYNGNGANTWGGNIILGSLKPYGSNVTIGVADTTTLTVTGVVEDQNPKVLNASVFNLTKEDIGNLIFASANTYLGSTTVAQGTLTIEDSNALGGNSTTSPAGQGTTVDDGAALALQVNSNHTDSVTGNSYSLVVSENVTVSGDGLAEAGGALVSVSGINVWKGTVTVSGATGSIGVDPDPNQAADSSYFPVYAPTTGFPLSGMQSLSVTGGIYGNTSNNLDKLGTGMLLLPNANTNYTGSVHIVQGWITVENNDSLAGFIPTAGASAQPTTTISDGAALDLRATTTNLNLFENFVVNGIGITNPYSLLNQEGAILSLVGTNILSGIITLGGEVGIGVQPSPTGWDPDSLGSLMTLTGTLFETSPTVNVNIPSSGSNKEKDVIIPTGSTAGGTLTIHYAMHPEPDLLTVYFGPVGTAGSTELMNTQDPSDSYGVSYGGTVVVTFNSTSATAVWTQYNKGTVGPYYDDNGNGIKQVTTETYTFSPAITSTDIEFIVNQGGNPQRSTNWTVTATFVGAQVTGGIIKLGGNRLIIQGNGDYKGKDIVQEGVLQVQNQTALGQSGSATVVDAGAALELSGSTAPFNGGISAQNGLGYGLDIQGVSLTLNGDGNALLGDYAPLINLEGDNIWTGNVTLANSLDFILNTDSLLTINGNIDDAPNTATNGSDLILAGSGELILGGTNTYRGTTFVGAASNPDGITTLLGEAASAYPSGEPILTLTNSDALGGTGTSSVQTLAINGTSGTFTLSFGGETTVPLAYNATAATIETALNNLGSISGVGGSVTVSQNGIVYTITFEGALEGFNQPLLVESDVSGVPLAEVTQTVAGGGGTWVDNGATLQLQGNLTIAGEPLILQGSGAATVPSTAEVSWFAEGPAPILNNPNPSTTENNVTGRVTGVAVDPSDASVIFVSTAGGGAWRTNDGGLTWIPMELNSSVIFSGAIALAPNDPNIIYLGTGDADNAMDAYAGVGVYESTDGGHTWTLLTNSDNSNPLNGGAVTSIVVAPNNTSLVYAAVTDLATNATTKGTAGVWRYDGTKWTNLTDIISSSRESGPGTPGPDDNTSLSFPQTDALWSSLAIDTNGSTTTLYAALSTQTETGYITSDNAVYESTNAASANPTWDIGGFTASGTFNNIKLSDVNGEVFASIPTPNQTIPTETEIGTSGGTTWTAVTNPTTAIAYVAPYLGGGTSTGIADNAIVAVSSTQFYEGYEPILEWNYTGTKWVATTITTDSSGNGPFPYVQAMALDSSNNLYVATDGGVWKYTTVSSSNTWSDLTGNLPVVLARSVGVSPTDPNNAIVGTSNTGVASYTGSPGWTYELAGNSPNTAIDQLNPNNVYTIINGSLYGSTTGVSGPYTYLNLPGLSPNASLEVDSVNSDRILVGGYELEESLNQGQTWQNLNSPILSDHIGLAVDQGTFQADPAFPGVTDQGVDTYVPDTIYVAYGQQIALTKNGGITWTTAADDRSPTLTADQTIVDLVVDPRNEDTVYVLVSSNSGPTVFETTNAGQTWTALSTNGLPAVPASTLVLDTRTDTLYMGTNNGVWALTSGASTWTQFGSGLNGVQVRQLTLNQTANTLTAATYGLGVQVLNLPDFQMTANSGALRSLSGDAIWTGTIQLEGPTTISAGGTQTIQNGVATAELDLDGVISDGIANGEFQLTKVGQGNVVLSGANIYTGLTDVKQGALVVNNAQALGSAISGTVVENGSALVVESSLNLEPLYLYGNGISSNGHYTGALENVSGTNTLTTPIHFMTSTVTIGVASGSQLVISSTIDDSTVTPDATQFPSNIGDSTLIKELSGRLLLTGINTYTGDTDIYQGQLNVQNSQALGANTAADIYVTNGAQLQLQASTTPIVFNGQTLHLSGTGINNTGALENVSGNNSWDGLVTFDDIPSFAPIVQPASNVSINVAGSSDTLTIGGANGTIGEEATYSYGLTKAGPGTLVLQNDDSYSGTTRVTNGILNVQTGLGLGTPGTLASGSGTIVSTGATLQIQTTGNVSFGLEEFQINGSGPSATTPGAIDVLSGINTFTGNVTLQTTSTIDVASAAELILTGAIAGTGGTTPAGLTKTGGGTLRVTSNVNTYTGVSTINAGILQVDGKIANVSLNGGGLAGSGATGSVTSTALGGSINPGDYVDTLPGTLSTAAETLNSKTNFVVNLVSPTSYTSVTASGNVNLAGASLSGTSADAPTIPIYKQFTILQTTGTATITNKFVQGNYVFLGQQEFYITYSTTKVVLTRLPRFNSNLVITSSASSAGYGDPFTLTVTATVAGYGTTPPAGIILPPVPTTVSNGQEITLVFNAGSASPTTVDLTLSGGKATYQPTVPLAIGSYLVNATLDQSTDWNQEQAPTFTQKVVAATTTLTLISSASTAYLGDIVTVTATVANPNGPGTAPTGTVVFAGVAGLSNAPVTLVNGSATVTLPSLAVGTYTITATYTNSDGNFLSPTPNPASLKQIISGVSGAAKPTLHFVGLATKVGVNVAIPNFTVKVMNSSTLATGYTGQVTLTVATGPTGGNLVGTPTATIVGGVATFHNLTFNTSGTYTLQATSGSLVAVNSAPVVAYVVGVPVSLGMVASVNGLALTLSATAYDGGGAVATQLNGAAQLTQVSGPGQLKGVPATLNFVNGRLVISGLSVTAGGTYTFQLEDIATGLFVDVTATFFSRVRL